MDPDFGTLIEDGQLSGHQTQISNKRRLQIQLSYLVRKLLNKAEPPLTRVTQKKTGHLGFKRLTVSQMWHAGTNVCS